MATQRDLFDISLPVAADYSAKQFYLMTQSSAGLATLATTAGEKVIGVLQDDPAAASRAGNIRCFGITKFVAGGTIDEDDNLVTDSAGKGVASTTADDHIWGRALEAGSSGEVLSAIVFAPVPGGVASKTNGSIGLPLTLARELDTNTIPNIAANGGLLAADTTPTLVAKNAGTDQALNSVWAASNNDKICWQVAVPADLDNAQAITLHTYALSGGATDTPVLTWEVFFDTGDTDVGGNSDAIGAARAEQTLTVAAAGVQNAPSVLTLTLAPAAHTTDTVVLDGAWIEYTRK